MLENEMRELPEDIGPHEGKEFMLMRAGEKDVALFFEIEPEGLTEILSEGFCMLNFPQFKHLGVTFYTRIVFRYGFEVKALRLKEIVQQSKDGIDPNREHEIGEILSYTRKQVDAYLNHALQTTK
jgi:hypothetical protein